MLRLAHSFTFHPRAAKTRADQTTRSMHPPTAADKFPAIDVLRALAALAVVGCHIVALGKWSPEALGPLGYWLQYGWLGVDLFFVISGFVITATAIKLRALPWREYARVFWLRRGARILPLYYFTLVAFLLLVDHRAVIGEHAVKQVVTHALLIHQWWPETAGSINGVTWTLGIEVLFYLLAWLLVGARLILAGRGAAAILLVMLATIVYRLGVFESVPDIAARVFWTNQVFGVLDGFMLGAAIAAWHGGAELKRVLNPLWLFLAGVATLVLALLILDGNAQYFWERRLIVGGFRLVVAVAFAFMVLGAIHLSPHIHIPRPLRFLGDISYGIYLWHLLLLLYLQQTFGLTAMPLAGATVLLTLGVASLTFFLVEAPCQRAARRMTALPK